MARVTKRSDIPEAKFAFAKERKEPLTDASHVRNAIARFDQTEGVSDAERDTAFAKIKRAAKKYGVEMTETHWSELGKKPSTASRKKPTPKKTTAKKTTTRATATRKKSTARKTTAKKTRKRA
jgi:hypothetical protein